MRTLKFCGIFLLAACIGFVTGCPSSQSTIAALVTTAGNAVAGIAAIDGDSSLATEIQQKTNVAAAQILAWKKGTPATEAVEATQDLISDISQFLSKQDNEIADLALGTLEGVLADLGQAPAATSNAVTAHAAVKRVTLANPPKTAKEFQKQYNAILAANPALQKYALK